jgi:hypothetical protein
MAAHGYSSVCTCNLPDSYRVEFGLDRYPVWDLEFDFWDLEFNYFFSFSSFSFTSFTSYL